MSKSILFIILVILVLGIVDGQQFFSGKFKITHTERPQATLTGTILYKKSINKFRLSYDSGQTEWYNSNTKERTRKCGQQCLAIPFFESIPDFYLQPGDTFSSNIIIESKQCKIYNKAQSSSQSLQWIAVDTANLTCAALLKNGIQFSFIDVDNTPSFADSELDESFFCQSNTESCNDKLDMYLIGDESGSVALAGFQSEINFMKGVLDVLDVRDEAVHVGVAFFSDDVTLVQELTGDKARLVQALNAKVYKDGKTCIPCGLNMANINFEGSAARQGVPKVYVLTTDGKNNRPEPQTLADSRLLEEAARAKGLVAANGGAIIAIGVGTDYNITEFKRIVTNQKFIFEVNGFDNLKGVTNDVISSACEESDYICNNCPTGFCLCGTCQGCPGGCPNELVAGNPNGVNAGLLAGLLVAAGVVIAAAIAGIVLFMKKRDEKKKPVGDEERKTVDIEDRSERYSKLVRKWSTNEDKDKRVTKPTEDE